MIVFPVASASIRVGAVTEWDRRVTAIPGSSSGSRCNLLDQGLRVRRQPRLHRPGPGRHYAAGLLESRRELPRAPSHRLRRARRCRRVVRHRHQRARLEERRMTYTRERRDRAERRGRDATTGPRSWWASIGASDPRARHKTQAFGLLGRESEWIVETLEKRQRADGASGSSLGRVDTRPETTASFHDRFDHAVHVALPEASPRPEPSVGSRAGRRPDPGSIRCGSIDEADSPMPPEAWLITVALNLFRNERSTRGGAGYACSSPRPPSRASDPPASAEAVASERDERRRVRHRARSTGRARDRLAAVAARGRLPLPRDRERRSG